MSRIEILTSSDNIGGANRAAYRLYRALRSTVSQAHMTVLYKKSDDWTVTGPSTAYEKAKLFIRPKIGGLIVALQRSPNQNMHSANLLPSNRAALINKSDTDIVNLHWVGGEAMSIEDVGKIRKPVVWTFHDMWALCGAEHFAEDATDARWRTGYYADNRPAGSSGLDMDRYTWNRKRRAWTSPVQIVTPSRWLAQCVTQSSLMKGWPVSVIPNVLDTELFKPLNRRYSRHALNLPSDKRIVLFGALGGVHDFRKGYDLLLDALKFLSARHSDILCVVFGQGEPKDAPAIPFPIKWMGHIGDDTTLALLYSAADVMVTPSRQENLPQSATEAHACGCPVVAFNCTGLPEVVEHLVTGYLAEPFEAEDLAHGIAWVLDDKQRHTSLGVAARDRAARLWSARSVVPAYLDAFEAARAMKQSSAG
jgi:glycosyltransferase involved in cell wall biosynthesis